MTNKNRLYLDIHAIQSVPPSNINRDDTGSPKTAQYGGVRRSRVSSQSWKKAMRDYFNENANESSIGVRTKKIADYVADKIVELDSSIDKEQAVTMAVDALKTAGFKASSFKDDELKVLFFLGEKQAEEFAKAAIKGDYKKKELQEVLNANSSIDIALFGRMVADDPTLNVDASSQVAHAISTHAVETEFDFFTAVDDLSPEDNAGAGMLGTVEYNSSTLYRYANIALHELKEQMVDEEAVVNAVNLYIDAFVKSMPTGKINTFANQTLPQLVLVTIRTDRPVNLVNAYEEPVKSSSGYVTKSIDRLFDEYTKTQKFCDEPELAVCVSVEELNSLPEGISEVNDLDGLSISVSSQLSSIL